jgi:hypothetical protein
MMMLHGDGSFRVDVVVSGEVMVVQLFGELDLVSMSDFERALVSASLLGVDQVLFDLSGATFVCVQGYSTIGRFCRTIKNSTLRTSRAFDRQIFYLLGYDELSIESPDLVVERGDAVEAIADCD